MSEMSDRVCDVLATRLAPALNGGPTITVRQLAVAVLEAIKDLAAAIANDFIEPDAAIDRDEEGSFAQASRLGVCDDTGIEEMPPCVQADPERYAHMMVDEPAGPPIGIRCTCGGYYDNQRVLQHFPKCELYEVAAVA